MSIDWFTVAAQIVNFLILTWLLKKYLYKPVLDAVQAREKKIAAQLAAAAATETAAEDKKKDYEEKNAVLDRTTRDLLDKAKAEAGIEKDKLIAEARELVDKQQADWMDALAQEHQQAGKELVSMTQATVLGIARKCLADLADARLEENMAASFVRSIGELDKTDRDALAVAIAGSPEITVISALGLPEGSQAAIARAIAAAGGLSAKPVIFRTDPALIAGIGMYATGYKLEWSLGLTSPGSEMKRRPSSGNTTIEVNTMEKDLLRQSYGLATDAIAKAAAAMQPSPVLEETGKVMTIGAGIATVSGLPNAGLEELLRFPGNLYGIAFDLNEGSIGAVLLDDYRHLNTGDPVERTGRVMDVPVGKGLIGRVIDPLGRPLDGKGPVAHSGRLPIERTAPAIMDRAPVTVPLQTGIKVIDALIPVGRGQRELILGDRQTGKTAIAIDTILNQAKEGESSGRQVLCIYCAIAQQASGVARIVDELKDNGAMAYTTVMVTEGSDPPGLAYIAPYAATSIAEYFMEAGRDVLIVYDDLTKHARAYREISLLLRRPPGREAFPGDIFYIHSRLLERATHLGKQAGGGSLTALPIVETEAQNIAAYIPTNLISITDGQIYLSPTLFELGVMPAVDVGKSVSRVGGEAQLPAYHHVTGDLKLGYSQFQELESFARFGTRLDDHTRRIIARGQRIRLILKQAQSAPVPVLRQIALLLALTAGCFDQIETAKMRVAEEKVCRSADKIPETLCTKLMNGGSLEEAERSVILTLAREALAP